MAKTPASVSAGPAIDRIARLTRVLEDLFRIPFTRITFGIDVILGLVPGIGDFTGLVLGLPILWTAVRAGLPWPVVLVMALNVLLDAVLGTVPVLGNLFDLFWKAHSKNFRLLQQPGELPGIVQEARWKLAALVGAALVLAVLAVYLTVTIFQLYVHFLTRGGGAGPWAP